MGTHPIKLLHVFVESFMWLLVCTIKLKAVTSYKHGCHWLKKKKKKNIISQRKLNLLGQRLASWKIISKTIMHYYPFYFNNFRCTFYCWRRLRSQWLYACSSFNFTNSFDARHSHPSCFSLSILICLFACKNKALLICHESCRL